MAFSAAVAALLCAIGLTGRSLWLDEGATVAIVSQHGAALGHAIAHDGGNMLAFYAGEHLLVRLFGDSLLVLRLPSVIADMVTVGSATAVALRLLDSRAAALTAGLLTAVSLPLVFWGQDARGYALMATFGTLSWVALLAFEETGSRRALAGYAVAMLLALYCGFDAVLLIPAQLLATVAVPRRRAHLAGLAGALLLVALASIPLFVLALDRGSGQLFWVPGLSGPVLNQASQTLTSAGLPPNFHATVTTTALELLSWGLLVLAALEAPRWWRDRDRALVPAAWLLVPALLALGAELADKPVEMQRAAVLVMPALAIVLAWVIHDPRLPRAVAAFAAAAMIVLRLAQVVPAYGVSPENWQAAARYAASQGPACVAFYPQDGRMAFDYYVRGERGSAALTPVLPTAPWSVVRPFVESYRVGDSGFPARITARCPRLLLISSHDGQPTGPPASRADLRRFERFRAAFRRLYPGYRVRLFGYAAVVRVTEFTRG